MGIEVENRGSEIALAIPASIPLSPNSGNNNRMIMFAGIAGFVAGVFLAYMIEFWWSYRGIEPQPITIPYLYRETKKSLSQSKGK